MFVSDLIEGKGIGIFALLDEESKLPRPTYDHFTDEVHKRNKNHYRITVSTSGSLPNHREYFRFAIGV